MSHNFQATSMNRQIHLGKQIVTRTSKPNWAPVRWPLKKVEPWGINPSKYDRNADINTKSPIAQIKPAHLPQNTEMPIVSGGIKTMFCFVQGDFSVASGQHSIIAPEFPVWEKLVSSFFTLGFAGFYPYLTEYHLLAFGNLSVSWVFFVFFKPIFLFFSPPLSWQTWGNTGVFSVLWSVIWTHTVHLAHSHTNVT